MIYSIRTLCATVLCSALLSLPVLAADAPPAAFGKTVAKGRQLSVGGMQFKVPSEWKQVDPENSMRFAEFQFGSGSDTIELVVFFFAPGQGGTQEANIARWASQFTDDKGQAIQPAFRRTVVNNMMVSRIELLGNYSRGAGVGVNAATLKKNQALYAAIVTTPMQGNLTFHFFGPRATVKKHEKKLDTVLKSMQFTGH